MRILHIITDLDIGGAEQMLVNLLSQQPMKQVTVGVICLSMPGELRQDIEALGIPVFALGMAPGLLHATRLRFLVRCIRSLQPDIVQTWMYHSDLLGVVATCAHPRVQVVWGLHNSTLDSKNTPMATRMIARFNAILSRFIPARIVSCSQSATDLHVGLGYDANRFVLIPNGIDTNVFRRDPGQRRLVREALGVTPHTLLVGMIARFAPQKDHRNFIAAATIATQAHDEVHFVLIGSGCDEQNTLLRGWIEEADLSRRFHLLGLRRDVPQLTAALDIAVTASAYGEAFPLVIGESMCCEVPCVVTDVGDSALIVGATGSVVPPRDSSALALAMVNMLSLGVEGRRSLGRAARARILANYALPSIARRYETLYEKLMTARRA